jgi:hypothetical protein
MFNWLENMRKKPLSKRRLTAFSVALSFTGLLFVVWLTVWLPDFNRKQDIAVKTASFNTPKDNFFESISGVWSGISAQYGQLKSVISNAHMTANLQYQATTTATSSLPAAVIMSGDGNNLDVTQATNTTATSSGVSW